VSNQTTVNGSLMGEVVVGKFEFRLLLPRDLSGIQFPQLPENWFLFKNLPLHRWKGLTSIIPKMV
jgi:hypothetical protein